jgi:MAX-binding protein
LFLIVIRNKMIHNILEKNRRAHLKDCFENLQNELPQYREKKVTNLLILKQAIKFLEVSLL